jgi:hypothetical protein
VTRREAQEILLSCRPGSEPTDDPQVSAALELAQTDPELREWYEQHRAWDAAVRKGLNSIAVPPDLRWEILMGPKVLKGPAHWWNRRAVVIAAAAVIAFLITLGVMFLNRTKPVPNTFAQYRLSMIGTVLREYGMDLETNDMQAVRTFFGVRGAPAEYNVPAGLARLKLAGCGVLQWQGKPVSMVCFERTPVSLVWLFVVKANCLREGPTNPKEFQKVITCASVSWSEGDSVYLLASEVDEETLRTLL